MANKFLKKDVYQVLEELKKSALGISDKPSQMKGFMASFLPTGEPLNPEDYMKPWKPNATVDIKKVADGEIVLDTASMKRMENLSNTIRLVDKKIQMNEVYQVLPNASTISQTWKTIIEGANIIPTPPEQEQLQKKIIDKYYPKLRKTKLDEDGEEVEVDTKEYKAYKEFKKKYERAVVDYANKYIAAMASPLTATTWPVVGVSEQGVVTDAWNEWISMGYKEIIEEAINTLAAQGSSVAAEMIASAKRKFEAYSVAAQGGIADKQQYVELFPSNWADPASEGDGWTEYSFTYKKTEANTSGSSTSWGANAGFSVGIWSLSANAGGSTKKEHSDVSTDGIKISFKYALVDIERPYMDTVIFDINNWFLVGDHKAGSISNGKASQLYPESTGAGAWLPAIPKQLFVIKDLLIGVDSSHSSYDSISKMVKAGGSFGIGPFSIGGNYSRSSNKSKAISEMTSEGLKVSGAQLLGVVSHIVPLSPKVDSPKDSKDTTKSTTGTNTNTASNTNTAATNEPKNVPLNFTSAEFNNLKTYVQSKDKDKVFDLVKQKV